MSQTYVASKKGVRTVVGLIVVASAIAAVIGIIGIGLSRQAESLGPALTGSNYRLYESSTSLTPGMPLASTNVAAQLTASGQAFRLRVGVKTRPDAVELTKISANFTASCAIVSGRIYCSGRNDGGQLGNNTRTNTKNYTAVDTSTGLAGKTVTDVTGGALSNANVNVCAIADGIIYCWGNNQYGLLGTSQTYAQRADSIQPLETTYDAEISGVAAKLEAGDGHMCGITTTGKAFCWGTGGNGRLGNNSNATLLKPTIVYSTGHLAGKTVTSIATGSGSSCAIASGAAYCWGSNTTGTLGDGTTTESWVPIPVSTAGVLNSKTLVEITVVGNTSCALDTDGKAYCWGQNASGSNAAGAFSQSLVPVAVPMDLVAGGALATLAGENLNLCGIGASDAKAYCWGANSYGATGRNTATGVTFQPTAVVDTGHLSGKSIASISLGRSIACGIATDGFGFCFGYNVNGNAGSGYSTGQFIVAQPISTTSFVAAQGVTIATSSVDSRLEFAPKTQATCSAQTTGFQAVTTTSAIAWATSGSLVSGTAISATANDPVSGSTTVVQTYVSSAAGLTNPAAIAPGNTGLWDYSLRDNSGLYNQSYCLRMAYGNGTAYQAYASYPEIRTSEGVLSVSIVDAAGTTIASPSVMMPNISVQTACQVASGMIGVPTQKIRVENNTNNPSWGLTIAATGGQTSSWQHSTLPHNYDYNDSSGSPAGCNSGSDGDGIAGQLTVSPDAGSSALAPLGACTATGVSKGPEQAFLQGSVGAITLLSAGTAAMPFCSWDMTGVFLTQTLPAAQAAGTYTLDMTVTVVAQ